MSFQETSVSSDTFLDRWGHWVLWMGPYILALSLVAWTPRLALLLCGVEILQFTLHVYGHHPTHPMAPVSVQLATLMVTVVLLIVGILLYPISVWTYLLLFCQITFSVAVHDRFHGRDFGLPALIGFGTASVWWGIFLTMQGVVPGLPFLRAFLL